MLELKEIARVTDPDTVMRFIRILSELLNRMRYASNRRVLAETCAPHDDEAAEEDRDGRHTSACGSSNGWRS